MAKNDWLKANYRVENQSGQIHTITVTGRDRWALEALMAARSKGCTPINQPGPRWAAYIHNLRKLGLLIETVTEPHGGSFIGTHARYILRCNVTRQPNCQVEA